MLIHGKADHNFWLCIDTSVWWNPSGEDLSMTKKWNQNLLNFLQVVSSFQFEKVTLCLGTISNYEDLVQQTAHGSPAPVNVKLPKNRFRFVAHLFFCRFTLRFQGFPAGKSRHSVAFILFDFCKCDERLDMKIKTY